MLCLKMLTLCIGVEQTQLLTVLVAFLNAHEFAAIDRSLTRRNEILTLLQRALLHHFLMLCLELLACLHRILRFELLAILVELTFRHKVATIDVLVFKA